MALKAASLVTVAASSTITLNWDDCGDADTHVVVTDISPVELALPGSTTITGSGLLDQDANGGQFKFDAKLAGVSVLKDGGNLCEDKDIVMPLNSGTIKVHGLDCPVAAGEISVTLDINLLETSVVSNDLLTIDLSALSDQGDKLLCAALSVETPDKVAARPTPPPSPFWPTPTPSPSPTPSPYGRRRGGPSPGPAPPQPNLTGNLVYHLFERKYTGLANRDGGDFKGDAGFIFGTFNRFESTNPEASMEHNILEMSEVNVTGWGQYEECNAPGCTGSFTCPADNVDYCCTHGRTPATHTNTSLPGLEANKMSLGKHFGDGGWWFSFPKESQGVTWTEKRLRRIEGKCLGNAWRQDAGGCASCGDALDKCVADCIKAALVPDGNTTLLQATWDRVFNDPNECDEVALPEDIVVV